MKIHNYYCHVKTKILSIEKITVRIPAIYLCKLIPI